MITEQTSPGFTGTSPGNSMSLEEQRETLTYDSLASTEQTSPDFSTTELQPNRVSELEVIEPVAPAVSEMSQFEIAIRMINHVRSEISKAVVGQENIIKQILSAFLAGGHVLIEGVPGLGKTLIVKAIARTFNGDFGRVQFTPDLMPADVMGHAFFNMKEQTFSIRRGPVFTNLLLADEINRAPAKTQSALLEVMQEGQVTIEGESHKVAPPFMVLATQNPLEQEGTYPLPEAQLDRFILKIGIEYPTEQEEMDMVEMVSSGISASTLDVDSITPIMDADDVQELQTIVSQIQVDKAVHEYAVKIVRNTREWAGISIGAGPRGGIALIRVARAVALLNGRTFVTPDDIKEMALPTLRHRIALTPEMEIEGRTKDEILTQLLDKTPAPRI